MCQKVRGEFNRAQKRFGTFQTESFDFPVIAQKTKDFKIMKYL